MVIKNIVGDQHPYANKKVDSQRPAEQQHKAQEAAKTSGQSADRVVLSSEAKLRGTALQAANEAPDVRREKVDRLKQQVKDGTYKPDLKRAAANLVRDDLDLFVKEGALTQRIRDQRDGSAWDSPHPSGEPGDLSSPRC